MLWNQLQNQTVELGWDFYGPVLLFVLNAGYRIWAGCGRSLQEYSAQRLRRRYPLRRPQARWAGSSRAYGCSAEAERRRSVGSCATSARISRTACP